jgi:mannose-6-phosphate isomerase-like protein (cupin superfamily)
MTISVVEALGLLPEEQEERSVLLWKHAGLQVELYAPRDADLQRPHARDEIYVVIRGRGDFLSRDECRPVGPGDFIFVEAEVPHRFENFSDDLALWVFFYGPEGGEAQRT